MLRLTCSYCQQSYTSVLVIPEQALEEISNAFGKHLASQHSKKHYAFMQNIHEITALSIWITMVALNTKVLEEEETTENKFILDTLRNHIDKIQEKLGLLDEDDDEDETEPITTKEEKGTEILEEETTGAIKQ